MPSDIETLECLFDWFNAREVSEDGHYVCAVADPNPRYSPPTAILDGGYSSPNAAAALVFTGRTMQSAS